MSNKNFIIMIGRRLSCLPFSLILRAKIFLSNVVFILLSIIILSMFVLPKNHQKF